MTAFRSRWFVGSSSSSTSGSMNTAHDRATRFLHPPENDDTFRSCHVLGKPRPPRILRALASAWKAPMLCSSSSSSCRRSRSSPDSRSFSASAMYAMRFLCDLITTLTHVSSSTSSSTSCSCSTSSTSSFFGTGSSPRANSCSTVDLPHPFGPISPYLCPAMIFNEVFLNSSLPGTAIDTPSNRMSRALSSTFHWSSDITIVYGESRSLPSALTLPNFSSNSLRFSRSLRSFLVRPPPSSFVSPMPSSSESPPPPPPPPLFFAFFFSRSAFLFAFSASLSAFFLSDSALRLATSSSSAFASASFARAASASASSAAAFSSASFLAAASSSAFFAASACAASAPAPPPPR
eukprot:Rhum_TRINITY_DN14590_c23_g4::Rhum_TRINITY_DN14590_c23_g4_i1::g.101994::m.101994